MKQLQLFNPRHYEHGTVYRYSKRGCRCDQCRAAATAARASTAKQHCSRCGTPTQSKNPNPVCHPCRRMRMEPRLKSWPCAHCGSDAVKWYSTGGRARWLRNKYCSDACRAAANPSTGPSDPYLRRSEKVPGLKANRRLKLLHKWQRQGRRCSYCSGPCESVDHVVPIARGGTNYEGNLVPCCMRCNGSKSDWLLIEWRLRRARTQAAA